MPELAAAHRNLVLWDRHRDGEGRDIGEINMIKRSLTTILAADIAGFSRLVGEAEERALRQRHRQRVEIIDPLLQDHRGRVANTAGDSLLIEFPSAVDAVRFAIAMQTQLQQSNAVLPMSSQMAYRIGINIGDVVTEGDDLLGDGVNIAARLEALANPGGIVIHQSVREQVRDKLDLDLHDLGKMAVKNIARPVHAFQVVREGEARMVSPSITAYKARIPAVIGIALIVVLSGIGAAWLAMRPDFKPVNPASMALTLPQKPSIAVMPFEDLGTNSDNDWIGDGLTENIISTLALSPDMVVMGRATSFGYKERGASVRDIAQELGVRYVLSGSVQSVGEQIRVTAELSDAIQGNQIWSFKEDASLSNLFAVQDQIAQKLFSEMKASLTVGEYGRSIDALAGDFETSIRVVKGRAEFQKFSPEGHKAAEKIWRELRKTNPDSPLGPFLLGYISWQRVILGISKDPAVDFAEAEMLAREALAMQEFADVYALLAILFSYSGRYEDAIKAANKAVTLAPGGADPNAIGGSSLYMSGESKAGLKHMLAGMRLEPDYPEWLPGSLYPALLEQARYDDTITLARSVLVADVKDIRAKARARANLIVAYSLKGDVRQARTMAIELLVAYPDSTVDSITKDIFSYHKPRSFHQLFADILDQSGIPYAAD